ncbi:ATP-grasp domain-containing protein [Chelatococcus sp. GCM10030263]|uniref:ATP-grasp domain-containing protein n=1 Tax=Chelatococcus sp. GCM10030263 TaxID=3273387 RepID=UPI00361D67DF
MSPAEAPALLVAAQSGRALAAAARRAGFAPYVADLFGDMDTLALAAGYRPLTGRLGRGIAAAGVLAALDALAAEAARPVLGVVLGSGFEGRPALVAAIAERFTLLGTSAASMAGVKDPAQFAAACARHGVPHPPISLYPVEDPNLWLVKQAGGSGGSHIRRARPASLPKGCYAQHCLPGVPVSLAVLADGCDAQVVATTRQWTAPSAQAPWRYGGAIEPETVAAGLAAEMTEAIARLVPEFGLRGLISADCLVDGERWWLLEINPRPGATLDVIDRRPTPLLARHIAAVRGSLGPAEAAPSDAAGAMIVYAPTAVERVAGVAWPDYVMDRPPPGSRIPAGAPVATVWATASDASMTRILLDTRAAEVLRLIQHRNINRERNDAAAERQYARSTAG